MPGSGLHGPTNPLHERNVLEAMALLTTTTGMGKAELAEHLDIHPGTAQRLIHDLVELGLVETFGFKRLGSQHPSTMYRATIRKLSIEVYKGRIAYLAHRHDGSTYEITSKGRDSGANPVTEPCFHGAQADKMTALAP